MIIYYVLTLFANSNERNDLFGAACMKIIEAFHTIQDYSLKGLTKICYVSNSTISRLSKKLFYDNLVQFCAYLKESKSEYLINGQILDTSTTTIHESYEVLEKQMNDSITQAKELLNPSTIQTILTLIQNAERICIVGSPVPQSAYSLQMELNMQGKKASAYMKPTSQIEEMHSLSKNDLIILYDGIGDADISKELVAEHSIGNLIVITPFTQYKKIYNTPYVIPYTRSNFTMNLFHTGVITDFIISALQTKSSSL